MIEAILTVRQNIDSLIVQAKNTPEALGGGHEWPVAGQYVRVELQVFGHVAPVLQLDRLRLRATAGFILLLRRLLGRFPLLRPCEDILVAPTSPLQQQPSRRFFLRGRRD